MKRPRIALVFAETAKPLLRGIAKWVRAHEPWELVLIPTAARESMPAWLAQWPCDGIIGRLVDERALELFAESGHPFVDIRGEFRHTDVPLVHHDDPIIAQAAANHFLERAYVRMAYCGYSDLTWSKLRAEAFGAACQKTRVACSFYQVRSTIRHGTAWARQVQGIRNWLEGLAKPVGVMAANDALGHMLLLAAKNGQINVPDSVAVIGVDDDVGICEVCDPPLSSVPLDHELQGYEAARLLDQLMKKEPVASRQVMLRPRNVVVRHSSDVYAVDDPMLVAAVRYIRENACAGIGVADVLRHVPVSRSVLQRKYKRVFGATVNDAIIETRVHRAKQLLSETDLTLPRIAELAGFTHQQYMGAVFRKRVGTSPAKYRNETIAGKLLRTTDDDHQFGGAEQAVS